MNIQLTEEQVKAIMSNGEVTIKLPTPPKPITYQDLIKTEKVAGYYINSNSGYISHHNGFNYIDENVTNGVAVSKSIVERTILEYKIQHLIKANKLEGNAYKLVCDSCRSEILAYKSDDLLSGVLQMSGTADEVQQFITNYKELLLEYFSKF